MSENIRDKVQWPLSKSQGFEPINPEENLRSPLVEVFRTPREAVTE